MKWEGYNANPGKKFNKIVARVFNNKGIYYLLMIASLGLLLGASVKWHP